jgi:hypothetical protein
MGVGRETRASGRKHGRATVTDADRAIGKRVGSADWDPRPRTRRPALRPPGDGEATESGGVAVGE